MIIDFANPQGVGAKLQKFLDDRASSKENWVRLRPIYFLQLFANLT